MSNAVVAEEIKAEFDIGAVVAGVAFDNPDDMDVDAHVGATGMKASEAVCPHCFLIYSVHAVVDGECPQCGVPFVGAA